jgi:hypothetical protein
MKVAMEHLWISTHNYTVQLTHTVIDHSPARRSVGLHAHQHCRYTTFNLAGLSK